MPDALQHLKTYRGRIIKIVAMFMTMCHPAFSFVALSLWNCTPVGSTSYLTGDFRIPCSGSVYVQTSIFNAFYVIGVVVGWPLFLIWYLRRLRDMKKLEDERVIDRVGFLYRPYCQEWLFWDAIDTMRKLYMISVVAFFPTGTVLQIVLSLIVSVASLSYHQFAQPYRESWLNSTQMLLPCAFGFWFA